MCMAERKDSVGKPEKTESGKSTVWFKQDDTFD